MSPVSRLLPGPLLLLRTFARSFRPNSFVISTLAAVPKLVLLPVIHISMDPERLSLVRPRPKTAYMPLQQICFRSRALVTVRRLADPVRWHGGLACKKLGSVNILAVSLPTRVSATWCHALERRSVPVAHAGKEWGQLCEAHLSRHRRNEDL
jgi:hypothetical protein